METLAIIVPCYNEQEALPLFYKEASKVLEKLDYDYKLLLINDGSKDNTLSIIDVYKRQSQMNHLRRQLCLAKGLRPMRVPET